MHGRKRMQLGALVEATAEASTCTEATREGRHMTDVERYRVLKQLDLEACYLRACRCSICS